MKQLIFFVLLMTLLFGCSPKETPSSIPHQSLDANHIYLDATITDYKVEDGKYTIYFEHNGDRGEMKGKGATTESLYKGLEDQNRLHGKASKDIKYDVIVDGDDAFILGIAPSQNRNEPFTTREINN